jgi:hypothetical protein
MATSTALVLAGGGSFGAVQVGMLRALVAHAGAPDLDGIAKLEAIWRSLRRSEVFPVGLRSMLGLLAARNFGRRSRRAAAHHRRAPALPQARAGAHSAAHRGD